jgi:hypothetical protein
MISIASHANREGMSAWPSLKTIAGEAHLSKVQVIQCIRELERLGELAVIRYGGRGKSNSYVLSHVREWVKRLNSENFETVKSEEKRVKSTAERVKRTLPEPRNLPLIQPETPTAFSEEYFSHPKYGEIRRKRYEAERADRQRRSA